VVFGKRKVDFAALYPPYGLVEIREVVGRQYFAAALPDETSFSHSIAVMRPLTRHPIKP
jgi:hypothetical protein